MNFSNSRRLKVNLPCKLWTGHCNTVSGHGQRWDACDNPPCIEGTHLVLGTHRDNRNDMLERHPERYSPPPRHVGERHPQAKLTDQQVAELRAKYTGQRGQRAALAREYGITKTRVGQLLDRGCRQDELLKQ